MSLIQHNDAEGRIISSGGVVVRKENSYSEMTEFQWNVNQNQFALNTHANKIIKFEFRRTPRNDRIEDVVIRWTEENPSGVDYRKLPTFWANLASLRVLINNKEVVDLKTPEGIRNEWKTNLFARHRDRARLSLGVDYEW